MQVKRTLVSLAATVMAVAGMTGLASADTVASTDGDTSFFGSDVVASDPCQLPRTYRGEMRITGNSTNGRFANGVTLTGSATLPSTASAITVSVGSVVTPSNWTTTSGGVLVVPITTTVGQGMVDGSYRATIVVSGTATTGASMSRTGFFTISVSCGRDSDGDGYRDEVDNCPFFNSPSQLDSDRDGIGDVCDETPYGKAPTSPGTPEVQGANPTNSGVLTLGWAPASDPEGDRITYSVQHRDADDEAWATVGLEIEQPMYATSPAAEQEEGTWRYQVFAYDGVLDSEPALSPPVIVDKTAPAALTADVPQPLPSGWHKGSVTVRFDEHGDPLLKDGSNGSGVDPDSYDDVVTLAESGSHTVTETAKDVAGNAAAPTTVTVKVDATRPTVTMEQGDCPADLMVLTGTAATVDWTASDAHSGLATPASGSVKLDTSSVGRKTVTLPVATDNVGHTSDTLSCQYRVVFDWGGFAQPIKDGWNRVRAGSAVPVKFQLGGDHGLGILESGSPRMVEVSCPAPNGSGGGSPTGASPTSASISELKYTPGAGNYQFIWNTTDTMAGACFRLDLELIDDTTRSAYFSFGAGGR